MKPPDGPSVIAIIGAATGIAAFLWNVGRAMRERPRLHVTFYVFHEEDRSTPAGHVGPVAMIDIVNVGRLPAHVTWVGLIEDLPWMRRWPVVRSTSFRTRHRWMFRWLLGRPRAMFIRAKPFEPKLLAAGELMQVRLTSADDVIEGYVRGRQWAVVDTALRGYAVRITDNR